MESAVGWEDAATAATREANELVNSEHAAELDSLQMQMLGRLQDSNAVLSQFNDFSARSYAAVTDDFARNTRLLRAMKTDVDNIFRRIQVLKERLRKHYPEAYKATVQSCTDSRPNLEEVPR